MLPINPIEELVFYLMLDQKNSFHFGEISLGVMKLLEVVKKKGYIVSYDIHSCQPQLLTAEECARQGLAFEHQAVGNHKIGITA